ncbi:hypothetical protein PflSS101_1675 [Pseudomonas lactis]|uniref:Uncharacterized protein n=1 Tax=Pseudomonas lactis TaxID=1615674 RepID=I4K5W9_9PSED|nr:hypothetical protein PflSS101_1675 [Pseudomonas lactis]
MQDVNDSAEGKLVFISESSGNFISMPKKCIRRRVFIRSIFVSRAILPLEYMLDHIKGELNMGASSYSVRSILLMRGCTVDKHFY